MSVANLQKKLEEPLGFTSQGSFFSGPAGRSFGYGKTVGNGLEDWAPGAMFVDTDSNTISMNVGSVTTADWRSLGTGTAVQELVDAAGYYATDDIDSALQEVGADIVSAENFLAIPLGGFRNQTGAVLAKFVADTTTGFLQLNSKEQAIGMAGGESTVITATVTLPTNLNSAVDVFLHFIVGKNANDQSNTTVTVAVFPTKAGEINQADIVTAGGASTITALWAANTEEVVTVAAAGVDDPTTTAVQWNVEFTVGNNTTDEVYIGAVWLEFTGKKLT